MRRSLLLSILAVLGWLLVACSGTGTASPTAIPSRTASSQPAVLATASPTATTTAATASAAPATVTTMPTGAPTATTLPIPTATDANRNVILATTTSTKDSGLLDVLVPVFEKETGYTVKVVSVGTGAALELGARGEADVVLVHAPDAEQQWMAQGNGTERLLVMHNDFVIVGPADDPAGIRGQRSAIAALKQIAAKGATWISRDDNSGTDQLEKKLWKQAGIDPKGQPWYVTSGQGMGATLTIADQKRAYTLSDRGTFLSYRGKIQLQILVEGDRQLLNIYHVMPVNPAKFPKVNAAGGMAFAHWLVSPEAQQLIANYGKDKYGQPLFFPDAGKREDQLGTS
ncbi:MAG: substrate-binding domain-containing protein [Thermorudis peleae]|nr:substrate-binding domain-containing protein [Thermorudis peleae]